MCGIDGVISKDGSDVVQKVIGGIKRLEYRGYDSAGIAVYNRGIEVVKDVGRIDEIQEKLKKNGEHTFDELQSYIGIGHTRWATHGAPSKVNAHPHTSCKGDIAIVHNGIF